MKILSFILTMTMILFSTTAYSLKVMPDNLSGKPGEEVLLPVTLSQVDKPVAAFGTVFSFDPDVLTYKGITKHDLTQEFDFLEGYEYSPVLSRSLQ